MPPTNPAPQPLSEETLRLLQQMLMGQQLNVGDPTFKATARQVLIAMDELDTALATFGDDPA